LTFHVEPGVISYLRYTLESYDGMAVVMTIDPGSGLVEVDIAPGCEELINELLEALRLEEGITMKQAGFIV
jgi:hypothetical protein